MKEKRYNISLIIEPKGDIYSVTVATPSGAYRKYPSDKLPKEFHWMVIESLSADESICKYIRTKCEKERSE